MVLVSPQNGDARGEPPPSDAIGCKNDALFTSRPRCRQKNYVNCFSAD